MTPSPSSSKFLDTPPLSHRFHRPMERHPFAEGYEVPQWRQLILHIGLCALAYPILLVFVIASTGKSLFWARFSVGAGCGLLGFMLGLSLLNLARGILEAATWATVIHQSRIPNVPGVRLKDLATHSNNPLGSLGALWLLWDRHSYQGADREYRKFYDKRPWSLWILFFLLNVLLSGALSFLLGRVVDISVHVIHQSQEYQEVAVVADVSDRDINRAKGLLSAFENFTFTWTLAPFSTRGSLPAAVSFAWDNDTVYFSEVSLSQLVPGGSGFGTFQSDTTSPSLDIDPQLIEKDPSVGVDPGAVLRFPRWGIRIECVKIPDIPHNLVPLSEHNFTYLFTPRDTLRPLFQHFNLLLPQDYEQSFNFSSTLYLNDTLPSGINTSSIAMGARFSDNGVAHSMKSTPLSLGANGDGFITLEHILVRLNDSFAPQGKFGVKGNLSIPDEDGFLTFIGYDAAVCLELYEPWILEVYNGSVSLPSSLRIVDKSATITDMNNQFTTEQLKGSKISDPLVKRNLTSTNLSPVYIVGHENSVNQILKDNGRDSNYVPSPTLISFTSGDGPYGYTELSEVYYAKARALADATNFLPYFVGSSLSVARRYPDQVVTNTKIANVQIAVIIFFVCLMGAISALFVPRLPLDLPQRGFDLYSWFSAFYAKELVAEKPGSLDRHMELKEVVEYAGDMKFYYATN
ncbi:hypothetical protein GALMADRAFT_71149 [Galerina marginata CBS 339.88]|uniref:Uncharacterized protein n=1 Tax=Galerina marginata (strain CBS 339.88) TaxID=685588 RepID=A0A067SWR7_GALM3|nr:hypothetical protein GALMADRAFT_71149 [Galerina marginata CBS 339.88]